MKSLTLLSAPHNIIPNAKCFCVDFEKNVYFSSCKAIFLFDSSRKQVSHCADIPDDGDIKNDIVGMEYLFETNSIFVATTSGSLYLYNIDDGMIMSPGDVETGLQNFAWSPDQELIVLVTGANTLILMTKNINAITEKTINCDDFGESKPINVGWGSKTTQFHGSEGKEAALIKQKAPQQALSYDSCKTHISWRKDGEFFVTTSMDENKGYRQIRIWSREAILQFTGEVVEGLEEHICWKPHSNVIACSQQLPNVHQIIFFEKNGLRHGQFALPFPPKSVKVTTLQWNIDGNILIVIAESISDAQSDYHVMLWTCSNYHWFLKQHIRLERGDSTISLIAKWNHFNNFQFFCYDKVSGDFHEFNYGFAVLQRKNSSADEESIVASIDNENILITSFGRQIVPPPLCAYMYTMLSSVQSVFFAPSTPAFAAYLGSFNLAFFNKNSSVPVEEIDTCKMKYVAAGGKGFENQVKPYSYHGVCTVSFPDTNISPHTLCHWTWAKNKIFCVGYGSLVGSNSSGHLLLCADFPPEFNAYTENLSFKVLKDFDKPVVAMCINVSGNTVALQLENGSVLKVNADDCLVSAWFDGSKAQANPQTSTNMSIIRINNEDYVLILTDRFHLFCNENTILTNCTSYFITEEYLLVTTVDHVLMCFSRSVDLPVAIENKTILSSQVQTQKVEKGAKIIAAPSNSTKVVLQMPRGNLETVHPRALVLSTICKLLNELQFGTAFNLSKVHRIDMNVLHDYNPKKFIDNVHCFIDQVKSPTDLNLFLASLKNEDVCLTMYPLIFEKKSHETGTGLSNKINTICDVIRNALEEKDTNRFYHTLMGTYAKKDPPELAEALVRLKLLKDSDGSKSTQDLVDSSLNFLLYLVDVNELIAVALGTYDLEITIMVAQKSQKDPKEFLPFYNELQNLEENYRKYTIDMQLKRYKQALLHISKCDDHFDKCVSLVKEQRLYVDALYLFPTDSNSYKTMWSEYGKYLLEKRYYDESALAFTRAEKLKEALDSYKQTLNWEMALHTATGLNYSANQTANLCQELSEKLRSSERHVDAAYLLEHYVQDVEESITVLIEGSEWNKALLSMSKYKKNYMLEAYLKPSLKQKHTLLKSYLEEMSDTFTKHYERLKFLRTQKKKEAEFPAGPKFAEDDLFSDIGSVVSVTSWADSESKLSGSIMTKKSSKSRRKQKLKKYRLKEGSADEDLALIAALSETITKVDVLKDQFLSTLKALIQFGEDTSAKELQTLMTTLAARIEAGIPVIWCPTEQTNSSEMKYGPESTVNSITSSLQQDLKSDPPVRTDPELSAPTWRKLDLELQMLK